MSHHVIEFDEACKSCNSTGLYVGMGEHDGAAVVCLTCKGSGKHHVRIEYDDYNGRQHREGVKRVYQANPGISIGEKPGKLSLEDFGGIPYQDWLEGRSFERGTENRRFTCPAWWYQSADYERKPEWDECWGSLGRTFSDCPHFGEKAKCWKRFDDEGL